MKIKMMKLAAAAVAPLVASAASIDQVIVRQQWPWSTDVKVEYRLSGVTSPVDISVAAYNGDTPLASANLDAAITGPRHGITEDGVGTLVIDPVAAFGTSKIAIANFRVKLTLSDSPDNVGEVLYKIFDLTDGSCEDVTRAALLDGAYGSVETDFAKIGDGFSTSLSDVLIWTGVTNNAKYATTHLVMRKIPAKGATFTMGSPEGETGRTDTEQTTKDKVDVSSFETQHSVTFGSDYYIGVFEVTQDQWYRIAGEKTPSSAYSLAECSATRPVEMVGYHDIRGSGDGAKWSADTSHAVDSGSFLAYLRTALVDETPIDLPTEAQWEFACRAGTTTALYSGKNVANGAWLYNDANLNLLGRYGVNGGFVDGKQATEEVRPTLDTNAGTARVGSYAPNAYGLYDMLGNVGEWCLDWWAPYSEDAATDPTGPVKEDGSLNIYGYPQRILRGGDIASNAASCRAARRGRNSDGQTARSHYVGLRLCMTVEE